MHQLSSRYRSADNAFQPYSAVGNESLKKWLKGLQPKFDLPSEKTVRVKMIPELYDKVQFFIKEILERDLKECAITTGAWTSSQQDSLMSVTVHFVTPEVDRKMAVLRALPFNKAHTSDVIKDQICRVLHDWGLPTPIVVLRDSAANISKAVRDMNGIPCYIHTVQLVVKHSQFKQSAVKSLIQKSRKLVKKLRTPLGKSLRYCPNRHA